MKLQRVTTESPTESVLDRKLTISVFDDPHAARNWEVERSLRQIAKTIPKRRAPTKGKLKLLKLGSFGTMSTPAGSRRSNANMLTIEGVEGDYDGERLTIAEAASKLREAGLAALLYTSPSHQPGKPRWRVLCPTSKSLPSRDRDQLMARLMGALDGVLSPESFTRSQIYFFGHAERVKAGDGKWMDGHSVDVFLVDGLPIDLANHLDEGALDKHGEPCGRPSEPAACDELNIEFDEFLNDPVSVSQILRIRTMLDSISAEKWDRRDLWLTAGQALHHEFGGDEDGFELWDNASRQSNKYDSTDQRRVWESFGSFVGKPVTVATLFRLADETTPTTNQLENKLRFLTTEQCALAPSRGYIVKGLLAPGDVACIFGAPGAGKSLIAPYIGYQVALGERAFGMRTKAGDVFYVAAEDPHGMQGRIAALAQRQGHADSFRLTAGVTDLLSEPSAHLEALLDAVREKRPVLIFIDTLAIAFPGLEENDSKSMGRVNAVARRLTQHGAAVVLIHHDTKAEGSTPRGHSALNGNLDTALYIRRDADGIVRGKLTKNRNGTPDREIVFRIGIEELGTDEDGDPITAAFAEELSSSSMTRRIKLTTSEAAALAKLIDMEGQGRVSEEKWRAACVDERKVSGSEDIESRRRAMRRAIQGLARKEQIVTTGGRVASFREVTSEDENQLSVAGRMGSP